MCLRGQHDSCIGLRLSGLFSDLLREYACNIYRVDEFSCYEGGIGADIKGDRVLVGSAAFMNPG